MHSHTLIDWRHEHVFLGAAHDRNERRTWLVAVAPTALLMLFAAGGARDGERGGLAAMTAGLLKEGAGDLDADAFAARLAATGAIIEPVGVATKNSVPEAFTRSQASAALSRIVA